MIQRFRAISAALLAISYTLMANNIYAGNETALLKGAELASHAKVSLQAARMKALKVRSGTIADEELEKEQGGSGLRYTLDIEYAGETYEVGIDANTGEVLENAVESDNAD